LGSDATAGEITRLADFAMIVLDLLLIALLAQLRQ